MKRWTVMLIPHDRGSTRTFNVSAMPFWILSWSVVGVLAITFFTSAFFFQRYRASARDNLMLQEVAVRLEQTAPPPAQPAVQQDIEALGEDEKREIEERLRNEYETSISAITAELAKVYELEVKARVITGLAPRSQDTEALPEEVGNGKGGLAVGVGAFAYDEAQSALRPPQIIYGLSRPSADLILQEIRLRMDSLNAYIRDGEAQLDRLARVPSIRPIPSNLGRFTSRFGSRIDPINHRLSQHDGLDISANIGTPVYATAKGKVISSEYDGGFGNIVRVSHGNGIETWYAHMSARLVNPGEIVDRGEQIGRVGATGRVTGPHLHYEVHVNGVPVNVSKYITD